MKAYVCDKCKTTITDKLSDVMRLEWRTDYLGLVSEYHLCDICEDMFFEFMQKNNTESEESKCEQ